MEDTIYPRESTHLRVLLVGSVNGASLALAGWIREQGRIVLAGPLRPTAAVNAFVTAFRPQVIVFDGDSLSDSLTRNIPHLKGLAASLTLIVLACDASEALRRHYLEAGVDAVFSKTAELGPFAAALASLQIPPAAAAAHSPAP